MISYGICYGTSRNLLAGIGSSNGRIMIIIISLFKMVGQLYIIYSAL